MKTEDHFWKNFSVLRIGALSIILAVPLLPKFPLFSVPGTYVAIRIEDFLIGVFAIFWLFYFWPRRRELLKDNLNLAILFYLLVGVVSLISAVFVTKTILPHLGLLHYARRIEYFIPFFLASFAFTTRRQIEIALGFLFIATVGVFFLWYWPNVFWPACNLYYQRRIFQRTSSSFD